MSQMITDEALVAAEAESAVIQLPRARRTKMIASLDEDTRVERAWAEEIRRRVHDFRAGKSKTRPIDEVLDEVDEMLR
jgi:putative addiction module component (TIGR02574 family)